MSNFNDLFDNETISNISYLVENKMSLLNSLPDFKEKDKIFAVALERLESSLTDDLRKQFNEVMRLNLQVESYYFALAYYLGTKQL